MNKRIKIFIERDYDQVAVYLMQRKEEGGLCKKLKIIVDKLAKV